MFSAPSKIIQFLSHSEDGTEGAGRRISEKINFLRDPSAKRPQDDVVESFKALSIY